MEEKKQILDLKYDLKTRENDLESREKEFNELKSSRYSRGIDPPAAPVPKAPVPAAVVIPTSSKKTVTEATGIFLCENGKGKVPVNEFSITATDDD